MQKEFFDRFFLKVRHIDICSSDIKQLLALYKLYSNVYSLIAVFTNLEVGYGGRSEIHKKAKSIADVLVSRIEEGVDDELKIKCLEVLFDYSSQYMDEKWDDLALDHSSLLIEKYTGDKAKEKGKSQMSLDMESSLCNLIGICFYLVGETELAQEAANMIAKWNVQQIDTGEWTGLPFFAATKRLYAIEAYQSYTFDLSFDLLLQRGLDFYLGSISLPKREGEPNEEQLRELLRVAELLLFAKNRRQKKEQLERTRAIVEQYLKKIDEECGGGNMASCNKIYSELSLNCMSVLAACLMGHMNCNLEENKNREKSITETE